MWLSSAIALTAICGAPSATMQKLATLAGSTWVTSIVLPNKAEHVVARYERRGTQLTGTGTASEPGGDLIRVRSVFTDSPDGVVRQQDTQGSSLLEGKVRLEGDTIVFRYGPKGGDLEMIRDELTFNDSDTGKGVVKLKDGKVVATYTMRRVTRGTPEVVLDGNDPVELAAGRTVPGRPGISETVGEWKYLFASEASRAAFRKDRTRFGVQFGGACMNMGPLTGRGAPHLFAVHQGFAYLFASAGCRSTFAKNPDGYVDKPDAPIRVSESEHRAALAVLDKAAIAHGGKALDSLRTLHWHQFSTYKDGGREVPYYQTRSADIRGFFADTSAYDDSLFRTVAAPDAKRSWQGRAHQPWPLAQDEHAFLVRSFLRHPIWLLRNRFAKGFAARLMPDEMFRGTRCLVVQTHLNGATGDLFLDASNHRVVGLRYIGRLGQANAKLEVGFADWRLVEGVLVPFERTLSSGERTRVEKDAVVRVNAGVHDETFRKLL